MSYKKNNEDEDVNDDESPDMSVTLDTKDHKKHDDGN